MASARWQPPRRPRWVERLNAHGRAVGEARRLVSLDPDQLIDEARRSTALDDFGEGDWRRHYDVLLAALENESSLHLAGRIVTRTEILRSLRNRLQLTALWKDSPDIRNSRLSPVTFIVGSPRTGTSILHEVLACDPANRAPAMWEMLHPVESLGGGERDDTEMDSGQSDSGASHSGVRHPSPLRGAELRQIGDATTQFWHDLQPEYETMHANSGDLPNECIFITMNDFLSDAWGGPHVVPTYEMHLRRSDHRPTYSFHHDVLQTLQHRRTGERWLLKAPSHLSQLAALFAVYPEARIIQTHRDPLKTLPSTLSLLGTLKWMRCEGVDLGNLAPLIARGQATAYEREIAQRADGTLDDERFVDVLYADLVSAPLDTVAEIYRRLGWTLDTAVRERMADYLKNKQRGAHGSHRYDLGEMGLDAAEERARFAHYTERFSVPAE